MPNQNRRSLLPNDLSAFEASPEGQQISVALLSTNDSLFVGSFTYIAQPKGGESESKIWISPIGKINPRIIAGKRGNESDLLPYGLNLLPGSIMPRPQPFSTSDQIMLEEMGDGIALVSTEGKNNWKIIISKRGRDVTIVENLFVETKSQN